MLYRLVRTYLRPYSAMLGVLLALQLVATIASLYLPSLIGRIIDEGVAMGDTTFILSTGVVMLVVSFVQIIATIGATRIGAQTSASLGRDVRSSVFHAGRPVLGPGALALRCADADLAAAPTTSPRCRRSPTCSWRSWCRPRS